MESKYAVVDKTLLKNIDFKTNSFLCKRKHHNPNVANCAKTKLFKLNLKNKIDDETNTNYKQLECAFNRQKEIESRLMPCKENLKRQRDALPVTGCRERLLQEISKSKTVLIMGETGSGKTTQIPQFLLAAGYGTNGIIAVTQPRRVAAITVAKRVAEEQECQLGGLVGYTVRFENCSSEKTRIHFMTDGILLREALTDSMLSNYTVIMLDEVHERTINSDVLFGIVKNAQKLRDINNLVPLKIIVTSATMDIDHFGQYFGVRGMYLEGRLHPVRVMHTKKLQYDYLNAILITLFNIHRNTPKNHDILIFLTGQEEIETMAEQIRHISKCNLSDLSGIRVFPLYAQLPQNKQLECFLPTPNNVRKIILATNVAETSITIPGIRCVIDAGFVKHRVYNADTNFDVLRVVRISQAQAWQRCGRAGRDSPGICYRTYTQQEMDKFELIPKPEILRSNICCTVLQLLILGIDCRNFDFLDKPPSNAIDVAYKKLCTLHAIKNDYTTSQVPDLTSLGRKMAQFPLDPQYSKLLLSAPQFNCLSEMLDLVSVLSGENIFIMPMDKREEASLAHAKFHSKYGDHLTLFNVFSAFKKIEKVKTWCHDNFLNLRNLLYAREVRKQLMEIVERLNLEIKSCDGNYDQIRKCLLTGLFDNIAELQRDNFYLTVTSRQRAKIHPSSVFYGLYRPEYILYTEMVLTEHNYLCQITEIQPEWLAEVVPNFSHLNRIRNSKH